MWKYEVDVVRRGSVIVYAVMLRLMLSFQTATHMRAH